jgi:imidazolonepropionase-like amidohydrolase
MDDEGRLLMKQHGTYLVPTLEVRNCIGGNYPAEFVEKSNRIMTAQLQNFRKAVNAGVKIGFGTDIGVCPFGQNAREFTLMVQNGMTPMQAIQSATLADADLLGISDKSTSRTEGRVGGVVSMVQSYRSGCGHALNRFVASTEPSPVARSYPGVAG